MAAISRRSKSSTKRSRKTIRCFSDKQATAFQMACTCSLAKANSSGEPCRSGTQSRRPAKSTWLRSARRQNFRRPLPWWLRQVGGDLHQPGANVRGAAKLPASPIGSDEAVLREIFRRFPIAQRRQQKLEVLGRWRFTSESKSCSSTAQLLSSGRSGLPSMPGGFESTCVCIRRCRPAKAAGGLHRASSLFGAWRFQYLPAAAGRAKLEQTRRGNLAPQQRVVEARRGGQSSTPALPLCHFMRSSGTLARHGCRFRDVSPFHAKGIKRYKGAG
jgi:hypothetical protein